MVCGKKIKINLYLIKNQKIYQMILNRNHMILDIFMNPLMLKNMKNFRGTLKNRNLY